MKGMEGHTTVTIHLENKVVKDIGSDMCNQVFKTGNLFFEGSLLFTEVKPNTLLRHRVVSKGEIYDNMGCDGEKGEYSDHAVVEDNYELLIEEISVTKSGKKILLPMSKVVNAEEHAGSSRYIFDAELGTVVWEEDVLKCEVTGQSCFILEEFFLVAL